MSPSHFHVLLIGVLCSLRAEASFHLRSASEELHSLRTQIPESSSMANYVASGKAVDQAPNTKLLKALDVDWWFLARNTAISILITVTLVVGICVCIKFGEGKQAEHWGQWGASQEDPERAEKWNKIEEKMQTMDVTAQFEATDYQQVLKNVAQKVGREKGAEASKSGAIRSFFAKTFRLDDMNSAAGAFLQAMPAQEAMHWLQLQPKAFNPGEQPH